VVAAAAEGGADDLPCESMTTNTAAACGLAFLLFAFALCFVSFGWPFASWVSDAEVRSVASVTSMFLSSAVDCRPKENSR
jgi:hypothetical protein